MPMTDGFLLPPGAGEPITLGPMRVSAKVTGDHAISASTFEVVVPVGFDVGAHVHAAGEELFYVLEGELDLLAFTPAQRTDGNWQAWTSPDGRRGPPGCPGSLVFLPPRRPRRLYHPRPAPAPPAVPFPPP